MLFLQDWSFFFFSGRDIREKLASSWTFEDERVPEKVRGGEDSAGEQLKRRGVFNWKHNLGEMYLKEMSRDRREETSAVYTEEMYPYDRLYLRRRVNQHVFGY